MNTMKIKFTGSAAHEIEVQNCYPYLENTNTGKVVLVVSAKEEDATAADLEDLKNNTTGIVEYYEREVFYDRGNIGAEPTVGEWELKNTYTDYNSGEIRTSYQNGMRECRVTRVDGMVKTQAQLRADVDYIAIMADIPLV